MLFRPFQVKFQFQVFSLTEVLPWVFGWDFFLFFFSFFLIKKNLSSSFQEKLDVWPLCPLQGKYFIVIFLSSPPPFGSEILPHKQEFKNVCWLVKEKGPTSHFPRKWQKCWIFEKTFGFRPKENFNS